MINDPVLLHEWHPVARVADIAEHTVYATRLLDEELVLWRVNGRVIAGQDLCIHRGARLSLATVADGLLICPFHGWRFNADGQCVLFPAHPQQTPPKKASIKLYSVAERYGLVWVCLSTPMHDIPHFPEWEDDSYHKVPCGPYQMWVSGPRFMEHFFDVAHFAFVHDGILGDSAQAVVEDYQVETGADGVIARDVRFWQPDLSGASQGSTVSFSFHILRPLTGYLEKGSVEGQRFTSFFTVTPTSTTESTGWLYLAIQNGHDVVAEDLQRLQDQIIRQDVPVLESQRPELLPLDLQAELHLRADRTAIAYRRWLHNLGVTFGTA